MTLRHPVSWVNDTLSLSLSLFLCARSRQIETRNGIGMKIEILDGQSSGLYSNEPFGKRPVLTIEDSVLHFDDNFESYPPRNGL